MRWEERGGTVARAGEAGSVAATAEGVGTTTVPGLATGFAVTAVGVGVAAGLVAACPVVSVSASSDARTGAVINRRRTAKTTMREATIGTRMAVSRPRQTRTEGLAAAG